MKKINRLFVNLALCWISLPGMARSATPSATVNNNAILLKATAPYEDMAHYAIGKKDDLVLKYLALADAGASDVAKLLPSGEARQFEALRQSIHQAIAKKDRRAAADSAVTIFRMLIDRLDADSLVVPREVELLDYAGYKLEVLAAASKQDWKAIAALASESDGWWNMMSGKVIDKHLRATVASAVAGIKQAAAEKNVAMLQLGSQMILDLVDMLEDGFKAAKANPAPK